jgi:hypothetical protein
LKTPPVFWPLLLSVKAGAFVASDRPEGGLELIDQAIEITGDRNLQYPEFALVKGDLLLALSDAGGAESCFRSAYDVAESLGLRMPQLRAATRLTRLGRVGTDVLRSVYGTFSQGLEMLDLVEARALLAEADARVV